MIRDQNAGSEVSNGTVLVCSASGLRIFSEAALSVFCLAWRWLVIAALNSVLDFDFIEQGALRGAPQIHGVVLGLGADGDSDLSLFGDRQTAVKTTRSPLARLMNWTRFPLSVNCRSTDSRQSAC